MTGNFSEPRLPITVQFCSRVPAYTYFFVSILAILMFYMKPSLAPELPVRHIIIKPRRASISSLKSTTSTLVDHNSNERKAKGVKRLAQTPNQLHTHFAKLTSPLVKAALSQGRAIRPLARRMSMPARRFSEHISNTLTHPFFTPHCPLNNDIDDEGDSYFAPRVIDVASVAKVDAEVQVAEVVAEVALVEQKQVEVVSASPEKLTKFKSAARKMRAVVRISRPSA